ncbi:hypothetical protein Pf1_00107 [Flavobacterium columnare]|nr:hypothetical protein Pf1_00107 [Flavobacterium columnare]
MKNGFFLNKIYKTIHNKIPKGKTNNNSIIAPIISNNRLKKNRYT